MKMMKNLNTIIFLKQLIESKGFKERSRKEGKYFSRERKLTFVILVYFLLNIIKKSMQLEIDNFIELLGEEEMNYTKQALSESRRKLKPEAFKELNEALLKRKYQSDDDKRYKGYRVLAIDGSTVELPNTEELKAEYGKLKSRSKKLDMVLGRTSILYDVENELIVDGLLCSYDRAERDMAETHLENYLEFKASIGNKGKDLLLFDRGYPSLYLITYMLNRKLDFVMRITTSFLKETNEVILREGLQDEEIEVNITNSKLNNSIRNKKLRNEVKLGDKVKLRVLKIELDSGEYEYLITSLFDKEEMKTEYFKQIYFKRWGVETTYDKLKNTIEIENFTGKKSIIIKQDFNISLLINNISTLIIEDAQREIAEEMENKNNKYEYKINRNLAIGYVKDRFINILLEKDEKTVNKAYLKLIKKVKKNKVPIREGRKYSREVVHKRKFSLTRKRTI